MDSLNEIISNLLQNLGSRKEIEQYLREFTHVDQTKFAVIKVGGGILEDSMDDLASALAFLRRVGLFPIVMHGAGPQLNRALEQAGIETKKIDGLRVTSPDVLGIVRRTLHTINFALVDELEALGVRARPVMTGVFESEILDADKYGLVGEVKRVDLHPIEAAIRAGQLPIVSCLGETKSGQILNVNADIAARELAIAVQPYKIVFLTPTGGLLNAKGEIIPAVNLVEDYDSLMTESWVADGMRLKLAEVKHLLDALPAESSVSITTPEHLAKELFTHRGSGTLVRRGETVELHDSFDEVDRDRLRRLIESSFGRRLVPDYFDSRSADAILVTRNYSAAAVITREDTMPYLDKFAVTAQAQGSGLGASLWSRMRRVVPQLYWRSRPENPITPWYFQKADGMHRTKDWVVFWYGIESREMIERCIDRALSIPPSLIVESKGVHSREEVSIV